MTISSEQQKVDRKKFNKEWDRIFGSAPKQKEKKPAKKRK
jgi:hypothetical protein